MAEPTNEMTINLPVVSVPPMGAMAGMETVPADAPVPAPAMDSSVGMMGSDMETAVIGSPMSHIDPAKVTVYAQSINPVSGNYTQPTTADGSSISAPDMCAVFDIVFSVGVLCGDGVTKTYQVVKRIGIDKCKIACEAESSTPVSVVEAKNEQALAEAAATKKRFRILAGLE